MTSRNSMIAFAAIVSFAASTSLVAQTWSTTPVTGILPGAAEHAAVYDLAREQTIVFGGRDEFFMRTDATWSFDGVDWQVVNCTMSPPPRSGHAMAYDFMRQRVVMFGGDAGPLGPYYDDTWEFDGSTWIEQLPVTRPQGRSDHAMASGELARRFDIPCIALADAAWIGKEQLASPTTAARDHPVARPRRHRRAGDDHRKSARRLVREQELELFAIVDRLNCNRDSNVLRQSSQQITTRRQPGIDAARLEVKQHTLDRRGSFRERSPRRRLLRRRIGYAQADPEGEEQKRLAAVAVRMHRHRARN